MELIVRTTHKNISFLSLESLRQLTRDTRPTKSGFTIVELLIVIVVIAILAAITIVAYNGISNRAHDTAIISDLSTITKKLAMYHVDNDRYPTGVDSNALRDDLATVPAKITKDPYSPVRPDGASAANILYYDEDNGTNFAIVARSKSMKLLYVTSKDQTVREYTGTGATTFPAVTQPNFATNLGLTGSTIIYYFIYAPPTLRIWS